MASVENHSKMFDKFTLFTLGKRSKIYLSAGLIVLLEVQRVDLFGSNDKLIWYVGDEVCWRTETIKHMKTFGVLIFECHLIRFVK